MPRNDTEAIEIKRVWGRQHLSVLECSPKVYHDIVRWIDEGRGIVWIMNKIDEALDCTPNSATRVTAATTAFDLIRQMVDAGQRDAFLELVGKVNRGQSGAPELKALLFVLAIQVHAGALLEGTYFDDVRHLAETT